ncbi:3-deoxy-7-phosphoheptulonate synthase [Rhodococcus sp. 14-2470-1b]|nr:3-deoxy-7-phosphoheptulonate synthase [Rhodococcus sp. 14-2470-1b]
MRPLTDRSDSLGSDADTDQTGLRATSATEHRSVVAQQPQWPDVQAVALVEDHLAGLAPLTAEHEVDALASGLALASEGRALVLQAGDCAEQFVDARRDLVRRKIDHLDSLSASMRVSTDLPVVTIGRLAGQYGKPRSSSTEMTRSGELIASYRGDAVNSFEPNADTRVPDHPMRLLTAYRCASSILDEIRRSWSDRHPLERVYASHEMLLMPYECPLVRDGSRGMYAASTHFGWIGERTRGLSGAHLEFARSVTNPVGVKLGPNATPEDAVAISRRLNPDGIAGRLTFIVRAGIGNVDDMLAPVVDAIAADGRPVVWLCDPMHGNGYVHDGFKTRAVTSIIGEVTAFTRVLQAARQWPAGLHLESTPDSVTECVPRTDGPHSFTDYRSSCDPRLNAEQSAEVVAQFLALL